MSPRESARRRSGLAAFGVAVALTAAACSSGGGSDETADTIDTTGTTATTDTTGTTDTAGTTGTTAPAADAPAAVPAALQFTAPLVGGGEFDGAAYGDKPTVFWFWAPT